MTSTGVPKQAARRRIVPVFCGMSGWYRARRMARLRAVAVALKLALRPAPNCPRRGPATALCRRGKNAKRTRVKTSSWERRGDHRDFAADFTGGLNWRDLLAGTCRISRPRNVRRLCEAAGV